MKYIFYIILLGNLFIEIKDFIANGGFNNQIAYNLFKINMTIMILQVLPVEFGNFYRFVVAYINSHNNMDGVPPSRRNILNGQKTRSISTRKNRFKGYFSE